MVPLMPHFRPGPRGVSRPHHGDLLGDSIAQGVRHRGGALQRRLDAALEGVSQELSSE